MPFHYANLCEKNNEFMAQQRHDRTNTPLPCYCFHWRPNTCAWKSHRTILINSLLWLSIVISRSEIKSFPYSLLGHFNRSICTITPQEMCEICSNNNSVSMQFQSWYTCELNEKACGCKVCALLLVYCYLLSYRRLTFRRRHSFRFFSFFFFVFGNGL